MAGGGGHGGGGGGGGAGGIGGIIILALLGTVIYGFHSEQEDMAAVRRARIELRMQQQEQRAQKRLDGQFDVIVAKAPTPISADATALRQRLQTKHAELRQRDEAAKEAKQARLAAQQ